jgi:hypothetical protein
MRAPIMAQPPGRQPAPLTRLALTLGRMATYLSGNPLSVERFLNMSLHRFYLAAAALAITASATAADPGKIQKCQDAAGKWHYGDQAAVECSKSKIEVISDQGVRKKTIAAPPTAAELADRERRKDEIERDQRAAEDKEKRDKILLQTYAVEDDIILVRDRKLSQVEATIKGSEETLKALRGTLVRMETQKQSETEKNDKKGLELTEKNIKQTNAQVTRIEALVSQKRQEQENLKKQYADELTRYRELKSKQPAKVPEKKAESQ